MNQTPGTTSGSTPGQALASSAGEAVSGAVAAGARPDSPAEANRRNLRRIVVLRWVALGAMAATIAVGEFVLGLSLPLLPLAGILATAVAGNAWTRWRVAQRPDVGAREMLLQLLADTAVLTTVLYCTGGWSNPFVSLFLLPLVIAATLLSSRHAWVVAAATFVCYSLLGFFFVPLPHVRHGESGDFDLHVLGMWASFVLSAGVIAHFVVKMAETLRDRDRELARAREKALRDQHVLALGTLAAGAAHQLGTPLSTMAVVVQELARDSEGDPELSADLAQLRGQIDQCKVIISDLVAAAGHTRGESAHAESFDRFLRETVDQWRVLRPGVEVTLLVEDAAPAPRIVAERTLGHTLIALLNNAADAARHGIEMEASWTDRTLAVEIRDRGDGVAEGVLAQAGRRPMSTKPAGHGVGLLIANAALERFGGTVTLSNRPDGGACTRVELPLATLAAG